MSSSPDPVATLRDAWRRASQSLSFTSVRRQQETSTHHLHIGGYSTVSKLYKHGQGVESKPFRAGGHRWKLTYYPNGYGYPASETGSPRVGLKLMDTRFLGGAANAMAGYTLSVLDGDGYLLCSRYVQPQHYSSWGSTGICRIDVRETDATAEETKAALPRRWLLRRFLD